MCVVPNCCSDILVLTHSQGWPWFSLLFSSLSKNSHYVKHAKETQTVAVPVITNEVDSSLRSVKKNSTFLNYNLNFSFKNLEAHFDCVDIFVNWSTAMKRTIQSLSLKLKWKVRDWVSDGCHFGAFDLQKYLLILFRTRRSLYCQFIE